MIKTILGKLFIGFFGLFILPFSMILGVVYGCYEGFRFTFDRLIRQVNSRKADNLFLKRQKGLWVGIDHPIYRRGRLR